MSGLSDVDIKRMRDQLFFEGPERGRRLSRYWLLLPLAAVIASAGVVSDSTATVIGAMIVAPLMTPILGIVLGVVLADGANLRRCVLLVVAGAAAVVAIGWLLGLFVPYPVVAATNGQVAARVTPRIVDLVAALATGAVGSVALARSDISGPSRASPPPATRSSSTPPAQIPPPASPCSATTSTPRASTGSTYGSTWSRRATSPYRNSAGTPRLACAAVSGGPEPPGQPGVHPPRPQRAAVDEPGVGLNQRGAGPQPLPGVVRGLDPAGRDEHQPVPGPGVQAAENRQRTGPQRRPG